MKQKVICILGMHRSGTSMLTRIINLMGIYLGKSENMVPPLDDNPEGFWEHREIVAVHDKILSALDSSYESTIPLPDEWWKIPDIIEYKNQLINILKREFNNIQVWAFKDPRTCLMLPMWKDIFETLDIDVDFIIPVRNPVDVANSLKKRNNIALSQGIRLWYYYMINIIEETNNYKRLFIKYDDIIENLNPNIQGLVDFLNIDVSEETNKRIFDAVKPGLRHSKTSDEQLNLIGGEQVNKLYNICEELIENSESNIDFSIFSKEMYKQYGRLMNIETVDKRSEDFITSVFIDDGVGYREELSLKQTLSITSNGEFKVEFQLGRYGEKVKGLRWDPLEGCFCRCFINEISIDNVRTSIKSSNAFQQMKNEFNFLTVDPMFYLNINCSEIKRFIISGKIDFIDYLELEKVLQVRSEEYEYEKNDLAKKVDKLSTENNESKKEIAELQSRCNNLLSEITQLKNLLNEIFNSASWKVTSPFRKIKNKLTSKA